MGIQLSPLPLMAMGVALAGVLLFGLAPRLPSLFPPSFARFVGFGCVCAALAPLWVVSESWIVLASVGGSGLLLLALIHLVQTRQAPIAACEDQPEEASIPSLEP